MPDDGIEPDTPPPPRARLRSHLGLTHDGQPLIQRLGIAAWSVIGMLVLAGIVVLGLAAISSVALPLLFAGVLAVLFRPLARKMTRLGVPRPLAAGIVVIGLVAVIVGVIGITVYGIVDQSDQLLDQLDEALAELDVSDEDIAEVRDQLENLDPSVSSGVVRSVASGLSSAAQLLVGALLAVLIMYYLIKDGGDLRRTLIARSPERLRGRVDDFIGDTAFVLRRYWLGRSIVSAIVATVVGIGALVLDLPLLLMLVVVTFVGGFIPYVGAFIGGLLAVVLALGSHGIVPAVVMLAIVLFANLVVENLVEPAVTGATLSIHPLVVLLATTVGGIVGGLAGLVMAVPLTVIATRAIPIIGEALDPDDG